MSIEQNYLIQAYRLFDKKANRTKGKLMITIVMKIKHNNNNSYLFTREKNILDII